MGFLGNLFLALLCVWLISTSICSSNNATLHQYQRKEVLSFLTLLPSKPVKQAVELINRRDDILMDYELSVIVGSHECVTDSALLSFTEGIFYEQAIAVIGPTCSTLPALQLSALANREDVSLINVHLSNANVLEDRDLYPYSFGMVASSYAHIEVFFALTQTAKWKRIALMYSEEIDNHNFRDVEQTLSQVLPDTEVVFSSTIFDTYLPLNEIKNANARVIFVQANRSLIQKILCLAYHQNLLFPTYQFVFLGLQLKPVNTTFFYEGRKYVCNVDELAVAVNGFIYSTEMLTPINYTEFESTVNLQLPDVKVTLDSSDVVVFDALLSLALALNNSVQDLHEMNLSLSHYQYGQRNVTEVIKEQFYKLNFEGYSGRIKFDPETGFVDRPVSVIQCFNDSNVDIAYVLSRNYVTLQPPILIDNTFEEVYISVELPITIIITLVLVIQLLIVICAHIMSYVYRNHRSIRASNLQLNNLVYAGCYFFVFTGFLLLAERTISMSFMMHTILCNASIAWTQFIGNTLVFGGLLVRMWKLNRIFKSSRHLRKAGRSVSDPVMFGFVILLVGVDIAICIIMAVVDPLHPAPLVIEETPVSVTYDLRCQSQHTYIWFSILIGYNAILVFGAFCAAFFSRKKVYLRKFNTHNYNVILLVYLSALVFAIGTPIMTITILSNDTNSTIIAVCTILNVVIFCCFVLLFLPPLIPIITQKRMKYNASFRNITHIFSLSNQKCAPKPGPKI